MGAAVPGPLGAGGCCPARPARSSPAIAFAGQIADDRRGPSGLAGQFGGPSEGGGRAGLEHGEKAACVAPLWWCP